MYFVRILCFFAGANSIFYGDRLLTTDNPETDHDQKLFSRLGIHPLDPRGECSDDATEGALLDEVAKQTSSSQQTAAPMFYDAMKSRAAKTVMPRREVSVE